MKKRLVIITAIILLAAILLISFLSYTPPILNDSGYNIAGRIYDFLAYAYYSSQAEWFKNENEDKELRRAEALVAWHRPGRMADLVGIKPDDLFQLGRHYAASGLDREAAQLFQAAFPAALSDEEKALEIISYLAILGDWPGTIKASSQLLEIRPDSAETNYWYGRALLEDRQLSEAMTFLQKAYNLNESLFDALYQKARINEEWGKIQVSIEQYEKVVSLLPTHREAWQALGRLYKNLDEINKMKEADSHFEELSPQTTQSDIFQNKLILLGYDLKRGEINTNDPVSLKIFFQAWRFQPLDLKTELILVDPIGQIWSQGFNIPNNHDIGTIRQSLNVNIPFHLCPGEITVKITFQEPEKDNPLRKTYYQLSPLTLKPQWVPATTDDIITQKKFGKQAYALMKKTILAPDSEIEFDFKTYSEISAVGLISNIKCPYYRWGGLPQGKVIANLFLKTEDGREMIYDVKVGEDTSDTYREAVSSSHRAHQKTLVFRSWRVSWFKPEFEAFDYYTIYSLPTPVKLKSLRIKCLKSGCLFCISDVVLIPSGDNQILPVI